MRGLLAGICLAVLAAAPAAAAERILDFRSDITVARDSTVAVAETIRVRAEGDRIRRGIYRDFPTEYTDRAGRRVSVGFDVESVTRDGRAEPFRIERLGNGVRIYIGDQDVLLRPGEYTYRIAYRTDRQLGFFERHDELYWNVTGNGWAFPIVAASARVLLPADVPAAGVAAEAYTGPAGARGRDFRVEVLDGVSEFVTTRALTPGEGLTVVVTWPKGHVAPPGDAQRAAWLARDNRPLAWALAGLAALLAYYLLAWFRVGRDPATGLIVPRYEPPPDTSPAALRYLKRMRYDDRCFAGGVLSLAVKGHLAIEQQPAGLLRRGSQYTLVKREGAGEPLADDEQALRQALFAGSDRLELRNDNHARVSSARSRHQEVLKRRYVSSFFRINGGWHALGVLLSLAVAALATVGAGVWYGFGPEWFFTTAGGWGTFGAIVAGFAANGVFGLLLKAPTVAGRKVMDAIEGFRLYLDVAEGDELKLAGAPRRTPSLFERYLPYALALGVEQRWAERFAAVFAAAGAAAPAWYHGDHWDAGRVGRFSTSLGSSLESAISSSATAPGSSSGSGGGGSSGGGGGGGGGGGW